MAALNMGNLRQHDQDFDARSDGGISTAQSVHDTVVNVIQQKIEESEEVHKLKMKQPVCSIGWTIADNRCYMVFLQVLVLAACAFNIFVSIDDLHFHDGVGASECDENYVIIRLIAPAIGVFGSCLVASSTFICGSYILQNMDSHNQGRSAAEKVSFSDLWGNFTYFRFVRKVIGWAGYLHFVSFGLEICSWCNEMALVAALPTAIALRLTHDSMWQRVYKHQFKLTLDKGYQGGTVQESNTSVGAEIATAVNNAYAAQNPRPGHYATGTQMSFR